MANIRAQLKRAFLQSLYDSVTENTAAEDLQSGDTVPTVVTLEDALKAFQRLGFQGLKNGRFTILSSGFSHEVRFAMPDNMLAFSQDEAFSMAQEFREVYADSLARLVAAGNATPADAQVLAAMFADDRLQSVTSTVRDHSQLRWNGRFS